MLFGVFFAFWRFLQIITLIPTLGMLAWFVHIYTDNNQLTPDYILVLFITSVLGAVWAICTLFSYHRSKQNAWFVSFIDLCFVGAFIAGVYKLRFISHQNCASASRTSGVTVSGALGSVTVNGFHVDFNKTCSMLKASFAFGIINCILFFFTSVLALFVGRGHDRRETTYVEKTHVSRHGHRRSGSHRSRRSSHSGSRRHAYV